MCDVLKLSVFLGGDLLIIPFFYVSEEIDKLGDASRWKEGLFARALANVEKKVDLMRLVYGQQESLQGSSLQDQDSDSDDEDLFRLRKDDHKVCFNSSALKS